MSGLFLSLFALVGVIIGALFFKQNFQHLERPISADQIYSIAENEIKDSFPEIANTVNVLKNSLSYKESSAKGLGSLKVIGVSDGDTITVLDKNNQQIKVRMANIDAPEKSQAFGLKAKNHLSALVYGNTVSLVVYSQDKYGRSIADVYAGTLNVNQQMVKDGYAWAYRDYMKDPVYLTLQEEAARDKRGLWIDTTPIEPSLWRKIHKSHPSN